MTDLRKAAEDLLEGVEAAIKAGDWVVDGACDPDSAIIALRQALALTSPNRESSYAGIKMWVGNKEIEYWVTKTCIEHEAVDGMSMKLAANSCLQAIEESNHD